MDLLDLDRRALAATGRLVDAIPPAALGRPTPCAAWDVRAVINHVVGNNVLYAAAAAGSAVDWAERRRDHVGLDPQDAYRRSASTVVEAFAIADLGKEVDMPFGRYSAGQALAVHFVDVLVHGWDLAIATDQDATLDPELASAAIGIVGFYPSEVFGTEQFFAEGLPVADDAPPGERLVAMLGRSA